MQFHNGSFAAFFLLDSDVCQRNFKFIEIRAVMVN